MATNEFCAWNHDLIQELFIPHNACIISSLPLPSLFIPDRCVWLDSHSGAFFVKKAYEINYRHPYLLSNFDLVGEFCLIFYLQQLSWLPDPFLCHLVVCFVTMEMKLSSIFLSSTTVSVLPDEAQIGPGHYFRREFFS